MNEDKLEDRDNEGLNPKGEPSPASNRLTPSELDLLMKAALSSRESTKKLFPHIKFV